jgi:hypothetical protein
LRHGFPHFLCFELRSHCVSALSKHYCIHGLQVLRQHRFAL